LARQQWIDAAVTLKGAIPEVRSGVKFGNGDGTIPAISLGGMCVRGWKGKTPWNPAGIKVITQGKSNDIIPRGTSPFVLEGVNTERLGVGGIGLNGRFFRSHTPTLPTPTIDG
jgi:hypothetical protein